CFFFQAEDGIRDRNVTGVQTCALPILKRQLDHLYQGQNLIDEDYKDLKQIDQQIQALQDKMVAQVEHAQRLATERANDREASLEEVVVQERNRLARDLHDS